MAAKKESGASLQGELNWSPDDNPCWNGIIQFCDKQFPLEIDFYETNPTDEDQANAVASVKGNLGKLSASQEEFVRNDAVNEIMRAAYELVVTEASDEEKQELNEDMQLKGFKFTYVRDDNLSFLTLSYVAPEKFPGMTIHVEHGYDLNFEDAEITDGIPDPVENLPHENPNRLETILAEFSSLKYDDVEEQYETLVEKLNQTSYHGDSTDDPPNGQLTSAYGLVTHLGKDDSWPVMGEHPMVPLIQIRVDEIPAPPPVISDLAYIAVFGPHEFPMDTGEDELKILSYRSLDDLVPVEMPNDDFPVRQSRIDWTECEFDYPNRNDLPEEIVDYLDDELDDSELFEQTADMKTKIGGWPAWSQFSTIYKADDFAFQIDSIYLVDWEVPGNALFYCFRKNGTMEWSSKCEGS